MHPYLRTTCLGQIFLDTNSSWEYLANALRMNSDENLKACI